MKQIVVGQDDWVAPWILARTEGIWTQTGRTIGLAENEVLVAGVLYDNFNGVNIHCTLAGDGRKWLNREFLWFGLYYPFEQLDVKRITAVIAASNKDSIRFSEHVGFVREATLENAHPDGDLYIYRLRKEDCKWLNLKRSQK